MKIISKYKDYYDYLVGIYGEDPLKILDRRKFQKHVYIKDNLFLYFCGQYYLRGKSDNLKKNKWIKNRWYYEIGWRNIEIDFYNCKLFDDNKYFWVKLDPKQIDEKYKNLYSHIPYYDLDYPHSFPILSHIKFDKIVPAEIAYLQIEEFISKKEPEVPSNPDDMNRYEGKGFDKKISFRKL